MTSHGLTAAYTNLTDSNIDLKIINRAGKLHQLPPSNSRNLIDYPPSKSGRKTPSTTPRSKSGRKTPSTTPPSNSRNLIDYPPSKSGRKTPCPFSHGFRFSKLDKYERLVRNEYLYLFVQWSIPCTLTTHLYIHVCGSYICLEI